MLRAENVNPLVHKRYLDYRERHGYFGAKLRMLALPEFAELWAEHDALLAKEPRDDEEDARLEELAAPLLRD